MANLKVNYNNQNIVMFETLEPKVKNLITEALAARELAYCPYSKFKVGAALECEDGTIVRGCNVENAAFTVGFCAERTAYVKAISEGKPHNFKSIAVVAHQDNTITAPCGACRQFISEFGNIAIYCAKPELKEVLVTSLNELLPNRFEL